MVASDPLPSPPVREMQLSVDSTGGYETGGGISSAWEGDDRGSSASEGEFSDVYTGPHHPSGRPTGMHTGKPDELLPIRVISKTHGNSVGEVKGDMVIELSRPAIANGQGEGGVGDGALAESTMVRYVDIFPVHDGESLEEGDIVFLMTNSGGALRKLYDKKIMQGLYILDASVYDLAGFGTDLVECVLSRKSPFIGKPVTDFGKYYGGAVVAVRNVHHKHEMAQGRMHAGDMVMLVLSEEKLKKLRANHSRDFYVVTRVGSMPDPVEYWDYGGCGIFFLMLFALIFIPSNIASSVQIVMTSMVLMIAGQWVDAEEALHSVDFQLLGLIGAALGLAKSVTESGLAWAIAVFVRDSSLPPTAALFVVTLLATLLTNIVTNNAAAALAVPVALGVADGLGVSYKPFVMSVLYASSISFMTPIGYQTNTMVWGPGGYTFKDFMKIGIPLNLLYVSIACAIMPLVFPF